MTTTVNPAIPNLYTRRAVAPKASKPCFICHKPTSTVLITSCNRDFFYVCGGHLADRGFATPAEGSDEGKDVKERKQQDEDLQKEIAKVTAEYEERVRKRKAKRKNKSKKVKDDEPLKDDEKKKDDQDETGTESLDEKEKDAKIMALKKSCVESTDTKADNSPRTFVLHKGIYQMRLGRIKSAQTTKREKEQRARSPVSAFPPVPKTL